MQVLSFRDDVNSGRSLSSSSSSASESGAAAGGEEEEALGLRVSNSVVLVFVVDLYLYLGASILAFLMGSGSGLADIYYEFASITKIR